MFKNIIRDIKILLNHKRRVNSIVIKSNEDIVRKLDDARIKCLEFERKGDSKMAFHYSAVKDTLEWLINESE